jgi:hypothetical protein
MSAGALVWIRRGHFQRVLLNRTRIGLMVKMAIVKIIHMIPMLDGSVAA